MKMEVQWFLQTTECQEFSSEWVSEWEGQYLPIAPLGQTQMLLCYSLSRCIMANSRPSPHDHNKATTMTNTTQHMEEREYLRVTAAVRNTLIRGGRSFWFVQTVPRNSSLQYMSAGMVCFVYYFWWNQRPIIIFVWIIYPQQETSPELLIWRARGRMCVTSAELNRKSFLEEKRPLREPKVIPTPPWAL